MSTTIESRHGVLITREGALAALHFFGDPAGRDPGTFATDLMALMGKADPDNRARLVRAFPEIGHAFLAGKSARDGLEMLRQVVAS